MSDGSIADSPTQLATQLTVGGLFRAQVAARGQHTALQQGEKRWSYAALNERVNWLVHVLAMRGLRRGDRVAILSENRPEYVEMHLAAAKLGLILACQNWRQSDTEIAYCVNLTEPKLALVSERYAPVFDRIDHGVPAILMFGEAYEAALARADAQEPPEVAHPEDGLIILYTSGTTGLPKGALISQRAMIARDIINRLDRPTDVEEAFVAWAPLYHMGSTDMVFGTLLRGGKVIIIDGFDPNLLIETIAREKIGWLQIMPGVVDRVVAELKTSGIRPKGVRCMGAMVDLVPRALVAEITGLLDAPYTHTFGSTETGAPPLSQGFTEIGTPPARMSKRQASLCQIRLIDTEDNDVPDGMPGEILVRTPAMFSGYWGAPEVTATDFRDGWFHMGDVFIRNPDATYDFVDRRKYLIKSGGENIYPAEIERLLLASPAIADAVVVRRRDERWGEVPVAFVVARDAGLTEAAVIETCRGKIANYKLPKAVRFVSDAELPRSTTGKIKRHELEDRLHREERRPS